MPAIIEISQRNGSQDLRNSLDGSIYFQAGDGLTVSESFSVQEQPFMIEGYGLQAGDSIMVEMLSGTTGRDEAYAEYRPARIRALRLDETLTKFKISQAGRYRLRRVTGAALAQVRGFPFTMTHEMEDYSSSLQEQVTITVINQTGVTSFVANDTNTIDHTTNASSGNVTLSSVVKLSAFPGNIILARSDGLWTDGLGPTEVTQSGFTVLDTPSINMTVTLPGPNQVRISSDAIISPDVDNLITIRPNGLFAAAKIGPTGTVNSVGNVQTPTFTPLFTIAGPLLTATGNVRVSADAGNLLLARPDGLFTAGGGGGGNVASVSGLDTATIDFNVSPVIGAVVVSGSVKVSATVNNIVVALADGIYAEGPNNLINAVTSVSQSLSIQLLLATNNLTANAKISAQAGNTLQILADGLNSRGPTNGPPEDAITSAVDTNTIDHTVAFNQLSSQVKISADLGNIITARADGIYANTGGSLAMVAEFTVDPQTLASQDFIGRKRYQWPLNHGLNTTKIVSITGYDDGQFSPEVSVLRERDISTWVPDVVNNSIRHDIVNSNNILINFVASASSAQLRVVILYGI